MTVFICVSIIVGSIMWMFYMMTCKPDQFAKLMEEDRKHKEWMAKGIGRAIGWWMKR